jgi:hypothetical protein
MKRIAICLALVLLFVGFANAQTKSVVGTVVDYTVGNSGKWAGIDLKVGNKKYFVYTESANFPNPKIVGKVDEVGRTVQVFYTKIVKGESGYDGELRAIKVVEIKQNDRGASGRSSTSVTAPSTSMIGYVGKTHLVDGCSCDLSFGNDSNRRSIYSADIDEKSAWMNFDGRDVRLKLVNSVKSPGRVRRGWHSSNTYVAGNVMVRIDRIATKVPTREGEEVTEYAATITVSQGSRQQTVKAVGGCGC